MTDRFDLVPPALAIKAMRDNGYSNAAYAIAELIDNALQANATYVELLCRETRTMAAQRERWSIDEIAVVDNGSGMTPDVLRASLQFGNGTRLNDRSGIGRFGMGLPSASISQCTRVDVWSWTDGIDSAVHTYIDLNEVAAGTLTEVPEPTVLAIPPVWSESANTLSKSGTLVTSTSLRGGTGPPFSTEAKRLSVGCIVSTSTRAVQLFGSLHSKIQRAHASTNKQSRTILAISCHQHRRQVPSVTSPCLKLMAISTQKTSLSPMTACSIKSPFATASPG